LRETFLQTVFALVVALLACSCSRFPTELTWTEEVRLSDGRIVQVERHEKYRVLSELGGLTNVSRERSDLRVQLGDQQLPPLTTAEMPLIIDVDPNSGTYFAITVVNRCYAAKRAGLVPGRP
jgi:hypothetical protein